MFYIRLLVRFTHKFEFTGQKLIANCLGLFTLIQTQYGSAFFADFSIYLLLPTGVTSISKIKIKLVLEYGERDNVLICLKKI